MGNTKVLFICMGNICRSPTAHGVFRQLVKNKGYEEKILTDSAGTHAYHVGNAPDNRSIATALKHNIDINDLKARQVHESDFEYFDYLLVMDEHNYSLVNEACPAEYKTKVGYFLDFARQTAIKEVPDPYYGEGDGFERVFNMIEDASEGLLEHIVSA